MLREISRFGTVWNPYPTRSRILTAVKISLSNEATGNVVTMRQTSGCSIFITHHRRSQIVLDCDT